MRVKVCGITSYEDAAMVLDQGVDALGFNFFPRSPRYISPLGARAIIQRLPPFINSVGLFVNVPEQDEVFEMARAAGIQVLQLHGDESPDYCGRLSGWPLIKAVRIGKDRIEENLKAYPVQAFLLDSKDDVLFGGTGKSFDWERAREVKKIRPVILAGGLRPDNVGEAIRAVMPYAVDVCSGVESTPGKKDRKKLADFMNEVWNVSNSLQRP
jgi:phosphoribosylanthranilate isomerase